ncbi:MAG: hypothetical protein E7262_03655 [Lachnospiraceae bacterium]|nr:hypothetical protein [Lachnospiraceae bacterium]
MKEIVNKFTKEERGVITVWITLLSIVVIVFIMVVIQGVRYINAHNICSNSCNLATMSLMADYDLDIYDNYGVYVMNKEVDKNTFRDYVEESLEPGLYMDNVKVKNIEYLDDKNLEKQITKSGTLYKYLLENFSSYKKPYIKGFMDRKYAYELEYIIGGENNDNDNIKVIKSRIREKEAADVVEELSMTDSEYEFYIIELLEQIKRKTIIKRIKEIIITNINSTFGKNIDMSKTIIGVELESRFCVESILDRMPLVESIFKNINNRRTLSVESKYLY